jgi:hypothetical protein
MIEQPGGVVQRLALIVQGDVPVDVHRHFER